MKIEDIGIVQEGLSGETIDGAIQLHDDEEYPRIEIYGVRDEFGNLLENEKELDEVGKELAELWNRRVRGEI